MSPRVSVVMSVYNGENYLGQAVESVLAQTFTDFEFIIVDDGSIDRGPEIITGYSDPRIRFIRNEQNLGLTQSLNKGLAAAAGDYVARMDCDDVSLPDRLAKQVAFMDANPQVGACGTWALDIDEDGKVIGKRETLLGDELNCFYWRTSLIHPSSMFRFTPSKGPFYDPAARYSQDYDLWLTIRADFELSNLPEHLLLYRVHDKSITTGNADRQMNTAYRIFSKHFGEGAFTFKAFKALMTYSCELDPMRRALAMRRLAKRIRKPYRRFVNDDLQYARAWWRARGDSKTLGRENVEDAG